MLFTTKGDNRVWGYDTATSQMTIRYQAGGPSPLSGVDNLWIDDPSGTFLVAEDGGDMEVVMIRPDNTAQAIVRIPGHEGSEVTGPCFSPDGRILFDAGEMLRARMVVIATPLPAAVKVFDDPRLARFHAEAVPARAACLERAR